MPVVRRSPTHLCPGQHRERGGGGEVRDRASRLRGLHRRVQLAAQLRGDLRLPADPGHLPAQVPRASSSPSTPTSARPRTWCTRPANRRRITTAMTEAMDLLHLGEADAAYEILAEAQPKRALAKPRPLLTDHRAPGRLGRAPLLRGAALPHPAAVHRRDQGGQPVVPGRPARTGQERPPGVDHQARPYWPGTGSCSTPSR